jgi:hypothetical protein
MGFRNFLRMHIRIGVILSALFGIFIPSLCAVPLSAIPCWSAPTHRLGIDTIPLSSLDSTVLEADSTLQRAARTVVLSEVVVRSKLNVASFIRRVQTDTSFYKAFRTLRVIGFTARNDLRMLNKKGITEASLQSLTLQKRVGACRTMETKSEIITGPLKDKSGNFDYYTAQLYADLFFTVGTICNENNIVGNKRFETAGKSGMEKHKAQLKMLFFDPGQRIPGLPLMGQKTAIFDEDMLPFYQYEIDMQDHRGKPCYVFKVKALEGAKNKVVINEMMTWFDAVTMEIVSRTYDLSYDAGAYDFDVHMEVQLGKHAGILVPEVIRYNGNWHVLFKKRERGIFTATLSNFTGL